MWRSEQQKKLASRKYATPNARFTAPSPSKYIWGNASSCCTCTSTVSPPACPTCGRTRATGPASRTAPDEAWAQHSKESSQSRCVQQWLCTLRRVNSTLPNPKPEALASDGTPNRSLLFEQATPENKTQATHKKTTQMMPLVHLTAPTTAHRQATRGRQPSPGPAK